MYGYATESLARVISLNQDHRMIRVTSTLEPQPFVVRRFQGRDSVSDPFLYKVELLALDAHLELKQVVGQPMSLAMQSGGRDRVFHGYVSDFARKGADGGFAVYEAQIAPWFAFLRHTSDCRVFQDLSVTEIIDEVFAKYGDIARRRWDVSAGRYPRRKYCVQYNESDFHFVSRLLEDEGIYYYFEHDPQGHTLVFADDSAGSALIEATSVPFIEDQGASSDGGIDEWSARRSVSTTTHSLKSYDFKQPRSALAVDRPVGLPTGMLASLEHYHYDGAARYADSAMGDALAALRSEQTLWPAKLFSGEGDCRDLEPGRSFVLEGHFDHLEDDAELRTFFLVEVSHDARNNFPTDESDGASAVYRCTLGALRRTVPYRPLRVTPQRRMPGPQTATVVGPPGEELHADRYGRVMVQFHWDRRGKFRDGSSCWIRCASPWAGADMGGVSPPRVGQEVVVDFLDGDPDRPLITGRVFNEDNMPPFGLEVSGLKSKTVKGAGWNEITMHDGAGGELLNMRAQRDMVTTVLNDQNATIQNNKSTSVAVNHSLDVGADQSISVGGNRTLKVTGDDANTITGNQTRDVTGTRVTTVTGAVSDTFKAGQTLSITASGYTETITGAYTTSLKGNYSSKRDGTWNEHVTGTSARTVDGAVTETLGAGRTVGITGKDVRGVDGSVEDSNIGKRTISVDGDLEHGASGTCVMSSTGDMSIASAAQVAIGVGESSGIVIDGGQIVISSNGSTIVVDASGVTVNGAKIQLN